MTGGNVPADPTTILDELFPSGAVTVLSLAAPACAVALGASELEFGSKLVAARLREFQHGRSCARRALLKLGAGEHEIPVGANREPIWPGGVVGSITHAGPAAAAVVGWYHAFASLGLDLEPATPLEPELVPRICIPAEISRLAGDAALAAKRLFGIKEAVYKALWPMLREFLDFRDIEVHLNEGKSTFSVESHTTRCPADIAARLRGRFREVEGLYAAGAALERGSAPQ